MENWLIGWPSKKKALAFGSRTEKENSKVILNLATECHGNGKRAFEKIFVF